MWIVLKHGASQTCCTTSDIIFHIRCRTVSTTIPATDSLVIELTYCDLPNGLFCRLALYRAMHFSANARSWDRMSSVRPSVTLVICDHIGWISWKLIARTISPTPSLFVAKRRSTYFQGNMGKFWGN